MNLLDSIRLLSSGSLLRHGIDQCANKSGLATLNVAHPMFEHGRENAACLCTSPLPTVLR